MHIPSSLKAVNIDCHDWQSWSRKIRRNVIKYTAVAHLRVEYSQFTQCRLYWRSSQWSERHERTLLDVSPAHSRSPSWWRPEAPSLPSGTGRQAAHRSHPDRNPCRPPDTPRKTYCPSPGRCTSLSHCTHSSWSLERRPDSAPSRYQYLHQTAAV